MGEIYSMVVVFLYSIIFTLIVAVVTGLSNVIIFHILHGLCQGIKDLKEQLQHSKAEGEKLKSKNLSQADELKGVYKKGFEQQKALAKLISKAQAGVSRCKAAVPLITITDKAKMGVLDPCLPHVQPPTSKPQHVMSLPHLPRRNLHAPQMLKDPLETKEDEAAKPDAPLKSPQAQEDKKVHKRTAAAPKAKKYKKWVAPHPWRS
ncbi:hypothetical protein CBOM_01082 [Ceraceosorus bombacis]|uniref:Uncharacterized protein n=1 Tax=Ceraceosorus bombacis TaxID=401625 RepID=A0A0P1BBM8_9BASI|nr:hypothetical protein CBOM_01082 [Ceraceosorus bombacis]